MIDRDVVVVVAGRNEPLSWPAMMDAATFSPFFLTLCVSLLFFLLDPIKDGVGMEGAVVAKTSILERSVRILPNRGGAFSRPLFGILLRLRTTLNAQRFYYDDSRSSFLPFGFSLPSLPHHSS